MSYEVTVTHLSGARRSEVETFTTLPLVLGRAEDADVRFDPDQDLKVSARHAELRRGEAGLELHDLDSTNGVLLDGARIDSSRALGPDVTIQLGPDGPRLRIQHTEAGGVSFAEIRMKTDKIARPPREKPLATTDQALPAYGEQQLGGDGAQRGLILVVLIVTAIVAATVALALLFS